MPWAFQAFLSAMSYPHPLDNRGSVSVTTSLTGTWNWRGHDIRYQRCGNTGPAVLLIHGFGGNWCVSPASLNMVFTSEPLQRADS